MSIEEGDPKIPKPFEPHPHLSDEVNKNIVESELEGGVWLKKMKSGEKLRMVTSNRTYIIWKKEGGFYIKGHPKFCPDFVRVDISGSTWGGSMLKMDFVGNGMYLEFHHPKHGVIKTSRIQEVVPLSKEEERIIEGLEQQVAEGVEEIRKEKGQ